MKLLYNVNIILVILLSIATGMFKILQQEADLKLFETIGMNSFLTTILGIIQLIGGILIIPRRTRKYAALIMTLTYLIASIAVFANGLLVFGVVSLLFIVMTVWVYKTENTSN